MAKWTRVAALLLLALVAVEWWSARVPTGSPEAPAGAQLPAGPESPRARYPAFLPPEAVVTLESIGRGGPFPYDRDGTTFRNRERLLPDRPHGYYREYTVETPGSRDRGARRIVAGGDPPEVYYYSDDHYRSFRRVEIGP